MPNFSRAYFITAAAALGEGGIYTPVVTNVSGITSSTPRQNTYQRINNAVHVDGRVEVVPSASGACMIGISLPIGSNLADIYDLSGHGAVADEGGLGVCLIEADTVNNRATLLFTGLQDAPTTIYYNFGYEVIAP